MHAGVIDGRDLVETLAACPSFGEDIAPCREHVRQVQQRLLADPPDRLLVTDTYARVRDGGGADVSGAQWRAHLLPLLEPLAAAATQVVIVAPPPSSANVEECSTRTSTPSDCVSTTPGHYRERAAADEQVAEQLGGVYVATESLWCLDARCPAFIGTTPTKFDFAHLTLAMAMKVAPAFREVLSAAGVEL